MIHVHQIQRKVITIYVPAIRIAELGRHNAETTRERCPRRRSAIEPATAAAAYVGLAIAVDIRQPDGAVVLR